MRQRTTGLDYQTIRRPKARPLRQARRVRRGIFGRRRRYSRIEKIGWLINGFIWTVAVWGALSLYILHESDLLRSWFLDLFPPNATQQIALSGQLVLPEPTTPLLATPTATRVVMLPEPRLDTLLAVEVTPTSPLIPDPVPTVTAARTHVPAIAKHEISDLPQSNAYEIQQTAPTVVASAHQGQVQKAAVILSPPELNSSDWAEAQPAPASLPRSPSLTAARQDRAPIRLVIDSIDLDASVVPVGWHTISDGNQLRNVWEVADDTVGWHITSALPGKLGNTVLNAHSNIGGEVFRYLSQVNRGDIIKVYVEGKSFEYKIDLTTIVKETGEPLEVRLRNAQWIAPTTDERLTLVTCWPYPYSTHRFIVVAWPANG